MAILFKLSQHGLLLWALAHRSCLDPPIRPAGPWPLTAPLPTWQIVALVVAFAVRSAARTIRGCCIRVPAHWP